jgi:hypothetical protein
VGLFVCRNLYKLQSKNNATLQELRLFPVTKKEEKVKEFGETWEVKPTIVENQLVGLAWMQGDVARVGWCWASFQGYPPVIAFGSSPFRLKWRGARWSPVIMVGEAKDRACILLTTP